MIKIEICVGSSCHLKGAPQVVEAFQQEIERSGLKDCTELQLVGSFCQGDCINGVVVKINDQVLTRVTPEKVHNIFATWVVGGISHASHYNA